MPNGDPDFDINELPYLKQFFSKISITLTNFSRKYNLKIDKYYHQSSSWDFSFLHPKGGVGEIEVIKHDNDKIKIIGIWWYDSYVDYTRSIKYSESIICTLDYKIVNANLLTILKEIVSWKFGEWTQIHKGYKRIWKKYPEPILENIYPKLKINLLKDT